VLTAQGRIRRAGFLIFLQIGFERLPDHDDPKQRHEETEDTRRRMLSMCQQQLGDEAVRRRLGPSAWKFFEFVTGRWQISAQEGQRLLALPLGTGFEDVAQDRIGEEQLKRIGCLVGIYRALHLALDDSMADQWVTRPNHNAVSSGQAPLAYMIQGGIAAMQDVRGLLEAHLAGN
jgi:hypothetical protein